MPQASAGNVISSSAQLGADVVLTGAIKDGEIKDADISGTAAIAIGKLSGVAASGANNDITSIGGLTTDLSVAQGGTGASTHTDHGVLIGRGTGAIEATSAGTLGQVLKSGGAGANPDWGAGSSVTFATTQVFSGNAPTSFTDLDLSATIGAKQTVVLLRIVNSGGNGSSYSFRKNGETVAVTVDGTAFGLSQAGPNLSDGNKMSYVICVTDANGILEWICNNANQNTSIKLEAYWSA